MDKNLTVEIFVPTAGSDGEEGQIGTGYPVGKGLLITARHVLYPQDRDENFPVQIRWRHPGLRDTEKGWQDIEGIALPGDDKMDVALIRAEFPVAIDSWGFITDSKPDDSMNWVSEGFARAGGKYDDGRRPVAMQGRTFSAADVELQFEIQNEAPVAEDNLWQGASGSPVFVGRRIIGIIITCPKNFNAARLRATPCWQLLENAEFRTAIGYDDQQARKGDYQAKVKSLLQKSPQVIGALAAELEKAPSDLAGKRLDDQADYLAGRLIDLELEVLLWTARLAQKSLQADDREIDAAHLCKVIRMLLPGVFDFGIVASMRSEKMAISQGFLSLPVSIHTVAEIVMAGYDGREATYRNSADTPTGAYCIPLAPEGGWDESGKAFQQAWDSHLAKLFGDGTLEAFDDYLIRRFARSARQRNPDDLVKLANDELEYLAESENKTHYFLFDLPVEETARQQVVALIRTLKQRYPAIVFLNLDSDVALERAEKKKFRPLQDILSAEGKDLP